MPLQPNTKAPHFKMADVYNREIDLSGYSDKRFLIGFFRHAGCPFCNLRVHTLKKNYDELKAKNFEMIFFFESTSKVILRSTFHAGVSPIPIISDPSRSIYSLYGLEQSTSKSVISHATSFIPTVVKALAAKVPVHMMADGESFSTMPAEFLVDKGLIVRGVHYSERLNQRIAMDDIFRFASDGTI